MGIKLKDLDTKKACNEGADFVPTHPNTGSPLDVVIRVLGRDSDIYVSTLRKLSNKRMRNLGINPASVRQTITSERQFEEELELLARCIKSWEGFLGEDGEPIPCNYENAVEILREFPWLREQIDAFITDRSNFLAS